MIHHTILGALFFCLSFRVGLSYLNYNINGIDKNIAFFKVNFSNLNHYNEKALKLQEIFKDNLDNQDRSNVAAALQRNIEKIFVKHLENTLEKPSNIALAGGLFANVKINQEIRNSSFCLNLFVQPAMADCGLSMGAAQLMNKSIGIDNIYENSALLGNSYSKESITNILNYYKSDYFSKELGSKVFDDIAKEINEGKIVGVFQGRMEWGPRALSARSILANPKFKRINNDLNQRLNRSEFMPFAPIVLDEDMNKLFLDWNEKDRTSQYMTSTYNINQEYQDFISAVVHIDKTARPQVVREEEYSYIYKVLKSIKKLTGIGVLINTSFNLHEEPIVESPYDALRALRKKAIDILYLEDKKVELKNQ